MFDNILTKKLKEIAKANNSYMVIFLAMLYVSCKLTCNPLFFRQIDISYPVFNFGLKVISSTLIFPVIYILSDLIFTVSNRMTIIFIIIIGILCDGLFSFAVSYVASFPLPGSMSSAQLINTGAINTVGNQIWHLFLHGLLATIIANIAEVLIFASIFKKINNFFISTITSVFIILFFHNIITDYQMMSNQTDVWRMIFGGLWVNMSILILYAAILSIFLWLKKNRFFVGPQSIN